MASILPLSGWPPSSPLPGGQHSSAGSGAQDPSEGRVSGLPHLSRRFPELEGSRVCDKDTGWALSRFLPPPPHRSPGASVTQPARGPHSGRLEEPPRQLRHPGGQHRWGAAWARKARGAVSRGWRSGSFVVCAVFYNKDFKDTCFPLPRLYPRNANRSGAQPG